MPAAHLALLRLHQRDASLDARERLTAVVNAAPPRSDVVALLTCHRVEIYAAVGTGEEPRAAIASRLATTDPVILETDALVGHDAARHLFEVATGLDSAIVGEGQIAGQVRRAHDAARTRGIDPLLGTLFQRALHLSREIRATTELGTVRRSIGSLAVDEALRHVPEPARATVLIVGAGEIGKLAARALARRVGRLVIANRDAARASEIATMVGAESAGLEGLAEAIGGADVVISAADTRGALITRELLAARAARRELVLVDIAVPRSVAEDARSLPGLIYRDVDDLATETSSLPAEVIALTERRCDDEAASYVRWLAERESATTIREVHERADAIRERQLARAMRRLRHLGERDREVVAALSRGLTQALLHEPTVRLRGRPERESAARALFGLDEKGR